jgi:hypothetical protein
MFQRIALGPESGIAQTGSLNPTAGPRRTVLTPTAWSVFAINPLTGPARRWGWRLLAHAGTVITTHRNHRFGRWLGCRRDFDRGIICYIFDSFLRSIYGGFSRI